jgi:succinate-semialdehyde dehydrogenase/glutarate-semialdehyde dehydrogenase
VSTFPTDEDERRAIDAVPKGLLVDGRWEAATRERVKGVEDPATGATLGEVADADARDAAHALDAAVSRQQEWADTAPRRRAEILRRAFELMVEREDHLALLATLEMGKPLAQARAELRYAADFLLWFSEEATRISGEFRPDPGGNGRIVTMRQPVGPSLLITPWNFPLAMATRKIGPAIAAGCTTVLKPASQTPLCALGIGQVFQDAGLPGGVLNIVTTSDATSTFAPLLRDSRVRKLSFTGSTEVGRTLLAAAADNVLRASMELGGNAPFLVLEDADLDAALDGAMTAKLRNMGQSCTAANRFLVHESIVEEFVTGLTSRMERLSVGRGTDPDVDVGPLIDATAQRRVAALVSSACDQGADLRLGGAPGPGAGHFFPPTVLTGVGEGAAMSREEIFGPVAAVRSFRDEFEAVAAANSTMYGLVAFVYTSDLGRAIRVSERIEAGMVGVNRGMVSNAAAPFGGTKQSGLGREGGLEGIHEYLETKYLSVATG